MSDRIAPNIIRGLPYSGRILAEGKLMSNKKTEHKKDQEQPFSGLAEYQVCQQSVNHHGITYWNMTSIFIAFSSVLLSAIIFGLISNNALFYNLIHETISSASKEVVVFRVLVTIIGLIILGIYLTLWRWLKRVRYLQQTSYRRMREIEIDSGMYIGLAITGFDKRWSELEEDERQVLEALGKDEKYFLNKKNRKDYAPPTSIWNHRLLFGLLALLWVLVIPSVWFAYLRYYKYFLIVLIILYILAFIYWPSIKDLFRRTNK